MEKFYLKVQKELVEVTEEVYLEYRRMVRRERAQRESDARHGVLSYDAVSRAGADIFPAGGESPEDAAAAGDTARRVRECVARLPAAQREVISALYFEGKSVAQLARETGTAPRTLGYRRDAALKRLRDTLGGS